MTWERLIEKMHKIRNDWSVIDWLYHVFYFVKEKITNLEDRCTVLEARCTALEQKVVEIFQTLTNHEERITSVENTQNEQENEINELCYHKGDSITISSTLFICRYSSSGLYLSALIQPDKIIPAELYDNVSFSTTTPTFSVYDFEGNRVGGYTPKDVSLKRHNTGYLSPYLYLDLDSTIEEIKDHAIYSLGFTGDGLTMTFN